MIGRYIWDKRREEIMATTMTTTTALREREEKAIAPSNSRTPQPDAHRIHPRVSPLRFTTTVVGSRFSPNLLDILTLLRNYTLLSHPFSYLLLLCNKTTVMSRILKCNEKKKKHNTVCKINRTSLSPIPQTALFDASELV